MKKEKKFCIKPKCNRFTYVNSKGLCKDCVFENNHGGKNKFEVYKERKSLRIRIDKPKTSIYIKENNKRAREAKNNQIEADKAVYREVFELRHPFCEECDAPLPTIFEDSNGKIVANYRFSHILGKGAHAKYRHESWNFNLLCFDCHQTWDFGDKISMKIYPKNRQTVFENIGLYILP